MKWVEEVNEAIDYWTDMDMDDEEAAEDSAPKPAVPAPPWHERLDVIAKRAQAGDEKDPKAYRAYNRAMDATSEASRRIRAALGMPDNDSDDKTENKLAF